MRLAKALSMVAVAATTVMTSVAAPVAGAEPPLHRVRYTVGASQDVVNAEIYFREVEPPNWADYSHNPYEFSPNIEADLGPGKAWVREVMLANPDEWAMVVVGLPTIVDAPLDEPGFVCELRVDDVVVKTAKGAKGALCSLRPW
ncbi:hypothetical protein SBI67_17025 [Mycolicibacterium sp. 120266]|uniref:hypothetical protein n=1 Tax=Mycolicibacterium sp. 120266 TaxID=3090601 RepID=UPI00299EDC4B|nr:hypothetical protein [Mycolicibacterium sp. 120266]MDX1873825.1 hypothetical protein [Mycolicibacterium sp. 120266]